MSEQIPIKKTQNVAAIISIGSAAVGFLVLPIILAPLAVIAGFVGVNHDDEISGSAMFGIIAGFCEIVYMLVQWFNAGLFG